MNALDGPTFQSKGPSKQYVVLNDSLSLVCGTGLDSNPQAIITWTAPDGTTVMDNVRYDLENGPDIVRLNITHTTLNDSGIWSCDVTVRSDKYIASEGRMVLVNQTVLGTQIHHDIQLTVSGQWSVFSSNLIVE